jgi:hypothetical protein
MQNWQVKPANSGKSATATTGSGSLQAVQGTNHHKSNLAHRSTKVIEAISPTCSDADKSNMQLSSMGGSQGQPLHVSSTADGLTATSRPQTATQEVYPTDLRATLPAEAHRKLELQSKSLPDSKIDNLEDALGEMWAQDEPFLHKYLVLGPVDRRQGGQGLVQFLRGKLDTANYAVKVCCPCSEFPVWVPASVAPTTPRCTC